MVLSSKRVWINSALLLSALFLPLGYSVNQATVTQTYTFTTSQTMTSVSVTQLSYTQVQTVPGSGPPPFITITNVHWNNQTSALSFYMQNAGGSGTVTLAIFVDGYSGTQQFHIDAMSANTFTLNFPSYTGSTPPKIRIVQQIPDSGPVPQQVVTWTMESVTLVVTTAYTLFLTQVSTLPSSPTSQTNPAPSPSPTPSLNLLILPLIVIVVVVALLLLSRKRKSQRGTGTVTLNRFCPKCGNPTQAGNGFCTACGTSLTDKPLR